VGTTPAKKHTVNLNLYDMVVREKSIIGSFNGSYSLQTAIPMLADLVVAGRMSLKEMISSKRPLSEINEAMEALEGGGTAIRQVILPPK
jgi:Zn-dependent alcohol dehydrogenase